MKGDVEAGRDLPTVHPDLVHHKAAELLALLEVQLVDPGGGAGSEVTDPPPEFVVGDELSALGRQFLAAASELPASSIDVAPASLHLVQVGEPGLVEASKAATFGNPWRRASVRDGRARRPGSRRRRG